MRIKDKVYNKPNIEVIVIPRSNDDNIVLKAQAILDFEIFEKLVPEPKPPVKVKAGGEKVFNVEDPGFKSAVEQRQRLQTYWIVLKSLEATDGLAWDTIDMGKPETWSNVEKELKSSGFSQVEIARIIRGCLAANSLDEARVEEARKSFLAQQREEQVKSV